MFFDFLKNEMENIQFYSVLNTIYIKRKYMKSSLIPFSRLRIRTYISHILICIVEKLLIVIICALRILLYVIILQWISVWMVKTYYKTKQY